MTVLVTGSGFVGAYAVRDLVRQGEEVVCYDIAPNRRFIETVVGPEQTKNLQVLVGDVTDMPHLLRTVRDHNVTRILHLAGILPAKSRANPGLSTRVNIGGTQNVFDIAQIEGIEKVVWMSSTAVFGPRSEDAEGVINNDSPLDPTSLYGYCKTFNEGLARQYATQYDLDITGLRLSASYGWGKHLVDPPRGTAMQWLHDIINYSSIPGQHFPVHYGAGDLDFLYIDDVTRAICLAFDQKGSRGASYIVRGDLRPVREAFSLLTASLPDADITLLEDSERGNIRHSLRYDTTAVERELGYRPQVTMEDGIASALQMASRYGDTGTAARAG